MGDQEKRSVQNVEAFVYDNDGYSQTGCDFGGAYSDIMFTRKGSVRVSKSLLIDGILFAVMGLICLFWPGITVSVVGWLLGGCFLVSGAISLASFIMAGSYFSAWFLIRAVVDILLGIVFILHPFAITAALVGFVGVGIILAGAVIVLCGVWVFRVSTFTGTLLVLGGIGFIVTGIVCIANPAFLFTCLSIFAVVYGAILIGLSFKSPRIVNGRPFI